MVVKETKNQHSLNRKHWKDNNERNSLGFASDVRAPSVIAR